MSEYLDKKREDLIRIIKELKRDLNNEKYGLYFNRKNEPEDVSEINKENIPTLEHITSLDLENGKINNLLIEGDNLHVLTTLNTINYTDGIVDIIFIDPPYNTGNKDFMYNDRFVDYEDGYRHTKWLNFIEKRLRLSRELLTEEGVIFISIDDNELAQLKLLCDSIFGEINFIGILPRVTKKSGKGHSASIARNHDYVVVYAKDISSSRFIGIDVDDKGYTFEDEYVKERGRYKLNQPLDYSSLWYNTAMDYPLSIDGEIYYPGGDKDMHLRRHQGDHKSKDWVWRWGQPKFDFGFKNDFVVIKDGRNGKRIYTKTYFNAGIKKNKDGSYEVEIKDRQTTLSSITFTENMYSNDNAKKELDKIGVTFDFPKPTSLVKTLLSIVDNKEAVVMDYFGGSGTTAQAVMDLNKEDGGKRKFILCTNNEGNIMTDVCYPRIKTVITGKRVDGTKYSEGIKTNLRFLRTSFVQDDSSRDQVKYNLMQQADSLLCIIEDTFKQIENNEVYSIFSDSEKTKYTIIYRDFYNPLHIKTLQNNIRKIENKKIVIYMFSTDDNIDTKPFNEFPTIKIKPVPNKIYEIYKNIIAEMKRSY